MSPMKKDQTDKPSAVRKSSSPRVKANLWTEVGQQHESSRAILTPVRRRPTLETVVNFHEGKLVNCYQRILNSDRATQVDVLQSRVSYSDSDLSEAFGTGQYRRRNDKNGVESEYETASEDEGKCHLKMSDGQTDEEVESEPPMETPKLADGFAEDEGSMKADANNSVFSSIEHELSSRIGKLLLYVKESSEAEVKRRGIFPECKLELLDERTLLLRKLAADAFLELDEEQTKEVRREWNAAEKPHEVLAKLNSIPVTRADLRTLQGLNWLNDEIINFYMQLLVSRSETNPLLPTVWTKDVDIFSYDLLIIPIHLSVHWALTVIDVRQRVVKYYDSLGGSHGGRKCLSKIGDYLVAEMKDKKRVDMDKAAWRFEVEFSQTGVRYFRIALAKATPVTAPSTSSSFLRRIVNCLFQKHMPSFRIRIAYEILQGKLL